MNTNTETPEFDTTCMGALGCGHAHAAGSAGACWEAGCDPRCPHPAHTGVTTRPTTLVGRYVIPRGWSADDVYAAVLTAQHERAALTGHRMSAPLRGAVVVTLTYAAGIGEGEVTDCRRRMLRPLAGLSASTVERARRP